MTTRVIEIATPGRYSIRLAIMMMLVIVAGGSTAFAQSKDRDKPTPFTSNEVKGSGIGENVSYYYSFVAGPGEITITFDFKAKQYSTAVSLELFDTNAKNLFTLNASALTSGERKIERVELGRKQTVIMRLTLDSSTGAYMVRLEGPVEVAKAGAGAKADMSDERIGLPSRGTLRIEMEDGSAQEINLGRVRRIVVKP